MSARPQSLSQEPGDLVVVSEAQDHREALARAMQRVAQGDRSALRDVFDRTSAKLFGVCLRILSDRSEAEDVLQEVYVTVWAKAGSYDASRSSAITWLVALARNRAIDRLRASKSHLHRPIDLALPVQDPGPLALDALETDEDHRRLHRCMEELDPDHARYIRSAFMDGATYQVLAESVGVPLGTMKSWIRRALLRLRGWLES